MSLRVNVQGGTGAGTRKPYTDGHAPTCQCSRCQIDRMTRDVADAIDEAGGVPEWAKDHGTANFHPSQIERVFRDRGIE